MNKKKKVVFWISIIILALCVGYLVYYFVGKMQREKVYDDLKEQTVSKETPKETLEEPKIMAEKEEIPIDFDNLQKKYPDLYAWIEIPGIKEISYPVMQSKNDNYYYLDYTIDGEYGYPGSIYTEYYNSKDFQDFDTVIYGHNMADGTMFGQLNKYQNLDFMKEHREIIIYTPEHIYRYKVFAAVIFDDRHLLLNYDFSNTEDRLEYLTAIRSLADGQINQVMDDVAIDEESHILTLSTCVDQPDNRLLIEAVRVDE